MKHLKKFENFKNPLLKQVLKKIVAYGKSEALGTIIHPSEDWGDGEILRDLSDKTNDMRIKDILDEMADYSKVDFDGHSQNIFDYLNDSDFEYIADFLGLPRLNLDEEWTDEEVENWCEFPEF